MTRKGAWFIAPPLFSIAMLMLTKFPMASGFARPRSYPHRTLRSSKSLCSVAELQSITVEPIEKCVGEVVLPGSKSLSNRALLLAALSTGDTEVQNLLISDDIRYMLQALEALGVQVEVVDESRGVFRIQGNGGAFSSKKPENEPLELFLGNAGTAMRPLAAVLCFGKGKFLLDGVERMRERPIADLVDGLTQLGGFVTCSSTGCPPVSIAAEKISGGAARISGQVSSQFLSALLMAAPLAEGEIVVEITDELVSAPYVLLTIGLMKKFGVQVHNAENSRFTVAENQAYESPGSIFVEGDASSASYFLAAGAITGGPVTVVGCGSDSVQGDIGFAKILEQMGATVVWAPNSITVSREPGTSLKGVDVDCGDIPDAAMTLATVALFCEGRTAIRNVYNWRLKETERMVAIVTELRKLGVLVEEGRDFCIIEPPGNSSLPANVAIDTYDDHRMAMCFALVACGGVPVVINEPGCTSKTFPDFFDKLKSITVQRHH